MESDEGPQFGSARLLRPEPNFLWRSPLFVLEGFALLMVVTGELGTGNRQPRRRPELTCEQLVEEEWRPLSTLGVSGGSLSSEGQAHRLSHTFQLTPPDAGSRQLRVHYEISGDLVPPEILVRR